MLGYKLLGDCCFTEVHEVAECKGVTVYAMHHEFWPIVFRHSPHAPSSTIDSGILIEPVLPPLVDFEHSHDDRIWRYSVYRTILVKRSLAGTDCEEVGLDPTLSKHQLSVQIMKNFYL